MASTITKPEPVQLFIVGTLKGSSLELFTSKFRKFKRKYYAQNYKILETILKNVSEYAVRWSKTCILAEEGQVRALIINNIFV